MLGWPLKWVLVAVKENTVLMECTCMCKGLFVSKGSKMLVPWEHQLSLQVLPGACSACSCTGVPWARAEADLAQPWKLQLLAGILTLSLDLFLCGPQRSQKKVKDTSAKWSFPSSCVVLPHITAKVQLNFDRKCWMQALVSLLMLLTAELRDPLCFHWPLCVGLSMLSGLYQCMFSS